MPDDILKMSVPDDIKVSVPDDIKVSVTNDILMVSVINDII